MVCSIELAKRLKELGVRQSSLWYWVQKGIGGTSRFADPELIYCEEMFQYEREWSAYTVAELGTMLPFTFSTLRTLPGNLVRLIYDDSRMMYTREASGIGFANYDSGTEADARAKMLIELIEREKVKP
jgi:hypothetical protein